MNFSLIRREVYPIHREYEYLHLVRKLDGVDYVVDAKVYSATCAKAVMNSFGSVRYTSSIPPARFKAQLEDFIARLIVDSRLDLAVSIGAFAVIQRHNDALLPCEGYCAGSIDDARQLFLGAYMAAATLMARPDEDVNDTGFWVEATRGRYQKEDLWEMEMLFADSVHAVEVDGPIWREIFDSMMLVHKEHTAELRRLAFVERQEAWQKRFIPANAANGRSLEVELGKKHQPTTRSPAAKTIRSGTVLSVPTVEQTCRGELSEEDALKWYAHQLSLVQRQWDDLEHIHDEEATQLYVAKERSRKSKSRRLV